GGVGVVPRVGAGSSRPETIGGGHSWPVNTRGKVMKAAVLAGAALFALGIALPASAQTRAVPGPGGGCVSNDGTNRPVSCDSGMMQGSGGDAGGGAAAGGGAGAAGGGAAGGAGGAGGGAGGGGGGGR